MNDPVLKAIQGAIVSIDLSEPATGARLGRLKLQPSVDIRTAISNGNEPLWLQRKTSESF
ncbi:MULTISPECIES: hypothetical protein [unclassified Shinella]|uniref:hypothetical protein n=1 Tax=unclassified Shinella TaxID=2643062 RepID=UPI00234E82DE|nr:MULTISPECIES: hypothetical protein [unclassified Shinella]MCO5138888.1 hypothetical protein [Shinella sp.]MDC7255727.1 hypothetical protein [Shinella sp. YE25]